jgi:chromosome segregation ATPase
MDSNDALEALRADLAAWQDHTAGATARRDQLQARIEKLRDQEDTLAALAKAAGGPSADQIAEQLRGVRGTVYEAVDMILAHERRLDQIQERELMLLGAILALADRD